MKEAVSGVRRAPAWKLGGLDLHPLLVSVHIKGQVCIQAEGAEPSATVHEGHGPLKEFYVLHFGQRIRYK